MRRDQNEIVLLRMLRNSDRRVRSQGKFVRVHLPPFTCQYSPARRNDTLDPLSIVHFVVHPSNIIDMV